MRRSGGTSLDCLVNRRDDTPFKLPFTCSHPQLILRARHSSLSVLSLSPQTHFLPLHLFTVIKEAKCRVREQYSTSAVIKDIQKMRFIHWSLKLTKIFQNSTTLTAAQRIEWQTHMGEQQKQRLPFTGRTWPPKALAYAYYQAGVVTSAVPALGKLRYQEALFESGLSYIVSSRPAWVIQGCLATNQTQLNPTQPNPTSLTCPAASLTSELLSKDLTKVFV